MRAPAPYTHARGPGAGCRFRDSQRENPLIQRNVTSTRFITAAALALGLTVSASAMAADEGQGNSGSGADASEQSGEGQSGEPVSDAQLEKFAQAYGNIRSVRMEYQKKLQQAEGKEQQSKLKKEGRQEMMGAIQEAGLDVSEYQRIGKQLNQSQELQKRLQKMMAQSGGGSGSGGSGSGNSGGSGSN